MMAYELKITLIGQNGRVFYTAIDAGSIVKPGPIVVDKVIFLIYTPFDVVGLAFFMSCNSALRFSFKSSAENAIVPTEQ